MPRKAKTPVDEEKAVTQKRAPRKASAEKTPAVAGPAGRPPSEETVEFRKQIRKFTRRKRISNPELAEKLGIDTMKSQNLCKPLVETGELVKEKEGRVTFYQAA